ncbi:MAG: DNA/RNA non-specific endonuclease [Bacteroidales bacterium]|nr:DNA/RNA non-specific endonuclease [Bacteroidales bacterium]
MKNLFFIVFFGALTSNLTAQKADVLLPSDMDREQTIHHKGYSLSYNSSYVLPSWVCYKVTKAQVNKDARIKGKYIEDPEVTTRSASKKDYKQGGYVMAQFVSYLDVKQIPGAVDETFYMSNIAPMKLAYYNHIWVKTEDLIRIWSTETDGLYIVCGPVLTDSPFPTIGDNKVSVPNRYYKVVYDPGNEKAIAFLFKNGTSSGKLKSYTTSVDEIEKITGIDMFHSLDDELEKKIESNYDVDNWNFDIEL